MSATNGELIAAETHGDFAHVTLRVPLSADIEWTMADFYSIEFAHRGLYALRNSEGPRIRSDFASTERVEIAEAAK